MHRPAVTVVPAAVLLFAVLLLFGGINVASAVPAAPTTPAAPGATTTPTPPAAPAATSPTRGARIFAGQDGRYTVDGSWLFRRDLGDVGLREGWASQRSPEGWSRGRVPSVWTAGDNSLESMIGGVAWYRRELRLPAIEKERQGGRWILRFERVSVGATVWVNGRRIGNHRGAWEPFELAIPTALIRRDGSVTIVVRTDSRRGLGDFPPGATQKDGTPRGGWWNDGGIPREVTLRYADQLDLSPVQITPDLPCPRCAGSVRVNATVRNVSGGTRAGDVIVRVGKRAVRLGKVRLKGGTSQDLTATLRIPKPTIWSPKRPYLYLVSVEATLTGGKRKGELVSRFRARTGIRSVRVFRGRLQLNFANVNLRGSGVHEMDVAHGGALSDRGQDLLLKQVRDLGGLVIRGHYPLHPRILEQADRDGLLVWAEIPVYQTRQSQIGKRRVRDGALHLLRSTITNNAYHPSVFTWSVGNELSSQPGPPIEHYFRSSRRVAKRMDPTRPLAYARQVGFSYGCIPMYRLFDLIGVNEYFGWYGGVGNPLSDPAQLGPYLDSLRQCYPEQALMITETGAEANRAGPATEPGTYAYQSAYAAYHLAVYRSRPWLSGALWWGLREFRVRPGWVGGNPVPFPPWHAKGLLGLAGEKKPAWQVVHNEFLGVNQLATPSKAPVAIPPAPPANVSLGDTEEEVDPTAPPGDGAASPGG